MVWLVFEESFLLREDVSSSGVKKSVVLGDFSALIFCFCAKIDL